MGLHRVVSLMLTLAWTGDTQEVVRQLVSANERGTYISGGYLVGGEGGVTAGSDGTGRGQGRDSNTLERYMYDNHIL